MRAVLRDVGIEREVIGIRRVPAGEAAGHDHAAAGEAQLTAREAGGRAHAGVLVVMRLRGEGARTDAYSDHRGGDAEYDGASTQRVDS